MEKDPFGMENMLKQHQIIQAENAARLEGLPFIQEEFSQEELQQIIELESMLGSVQRRMLKVGSQQKEEVYEYLDTVLGVIDNLKIWDSKFSTGSTGNLHRTDSIYYTTPSGISLRFKRSNIEKNLERVIQPFMESIVFYGLEQTDEYPVQMPAIGLAPFEYLSQEFYDLQKQKEIKTSFTSRIKLYFKDQRLYFMQQPEHLNHEHGGSPINKVYYIK